MLFSEGLHKHVLSRPKFERKQYEPKCAEDAITARNMPDDTLGRHLFIAPTPIPRIERSTQVPKNYGVDISTLTRWVELEQLMIDRAALLKPPAAPTTARSPHLSRASPRRPWSRTT